MARNLSAMHVAGGGMHDSLDVYVRGTETKTINLAKCLRLRLVRGIVKREVNNHKLEEEKRPRRALECCDVLFTAPPPTPGVPMTSFSQASPTPGLMVKVSPPACQRVFEKVKQGQKGGTGSPWVAGWTRCPPRIHRLASCNASATTSPLLDAVNSF